jgi:VWFA-related protein
MSSDALPGFGAPANGEPGPWTTMDHDPVRRRLPRLRPAPAAAFALALLAGGLAAPHAQQAGQGPGSQAGATPAPRGGAPPPGQPAQGAPGGQTGAQEPAPPTQPVFRTGINFVRVDAIVTDKQGNPVMDLTQADFEVTEDGKPQAVETFRLIQVSGTPAPGAERPREIRTEYDQESEAQRDDVRIFVIFLDDYHVRRGASMAVREPLVRFIRNSLGPLDMIGIMYPLMPVSLLTLTRNHEAIIREIEKFEGRKFDYRPRNQFEEQYSLYPAEVVERVRNQVSLSALEGLMVKMGGLREGRKAAILVSEGYSNYLPPQLRDPVAEMPGYGNSARRRPGLGDGSYGEQRKQFFDDVDILNELRQVYSAANRGNTAIYSLDPRGLAVFEFDINEGVGQRTDRASLQNTQDTLRILADETDGRAIVNRNDLEGGLKQVVRDSSAYYLLGYNSSQAPSDGKFHEIKVKVKRPGLQVRARKGYWALTAEETARATAPPKPEPERGLTEALANVSSQSASRGKLIRTWIGTGPGEDGKSRVTFVWEPVPPIPGEQRREGATRVSLIAAGGDGRAYYRGKVPPDDALTAAGETGSSSRSSAVEFDAVPGRMQLRLSVEGTSGQLIDSDVLDVTVPDYTAPQVTVTTPQVIRARTAIEVRQFNANPDAVPVADREFRRTDRLLIRFSAIGPGTETPETSVRLLNRAGQRMSDLPTQPVPGAAAARLQVDLPLAGLPAGEYVVEVKSSAGGAEAKQFVGFRVIS